MTKSYLLFRIVIVALSILNVIFIQKNLAFAGCEGAEITGLQSGEKVFKMKVKTSDGTKWAEDDDGFVVLAFAAAHKYEG